MLNCSWYIHILFLFLYCLTWHKYFSFVKKINWNLETMKTSCNSFRSLVSVCLNNPFQIPRFLSNNCYYLFIFVTFNPIWHLINLYQNELFHMKRILVLLTKISLSSILFCEIEDMEIGCLYSCHCDKRLSFRIKQIWYLADRYLVLV